MSEQHKRPGGLTALAVLNFVFGGFGILGVLAAFALLSAATGALSAVGASTSGAGMIWVSIILSGLSVALMIVSGIGYIKMSKTLGWKIGNAYAVVSIVSSIFSLAALGMGFGITTIIGMVYPVLTLILLNTTFKDDFVN